MAFVIGTLVSGVEKDHAIDYNEFMQLFPVRVQRMRLLKDRVCRNHQA